VESRSSSTYQISSLAQHYLAHRFDLLGSGWVQVKHGMECLGVEGHRYTMGYGVGADSQGHWLLGRINPANLADSQRIWQLIDRDYTPIDWHLDFKSGYRWSEDTWYLDIPYGQQVGVDVKVPWELARMQHLPQLAWAYALAEKGETGFYPHQIYAREFRNQVLDFIATNPPRFGVNWCCTMDVGIRVANWLVTYDLFRASGAEFDAQFEAEFRRSVYQHGLHIINNLEWSPELRSNHYLANIVGLLFVAAYLPRTPVTDNWLAFAIQELIAEVECQFYPDGANFEASTSYHRLSAEMVTYATALVLGLGLFEKPGFCFVPRNDAESGDCFVPGNDAQSGDCFVPGNDAQSGDCFVPGNDAESGDCFVPRNDAESGDCFVPRNDAESGDCFVPGNDAQRLEKMAEFTMHVTKPNDRIPQIGDNDSGRFLKLQPVYHQLSVAEAKTRYANLAGYTELPDDAVYWDEDILDHRHLVAAINGFFVRPDFAAFTGEGWLETKLVQQLAMSLPSYLQPGKPTAAELVQIGTPADWAQLNAKLNSLPQEQGQVIDIPVPGEDLLESLKLYAYPNFGLYLYRSPRLYLAIRCGSIGQNGNGGHAHNDQLAIELNIDGEDWIVDPGTYLYTPLPERRNEYRSVKAHFAPQVQQQEPDRLDLSLFSLGDKAKAKCLYFGSEGFIGTHQGYGYPIYRLVAPEKNKIRIADFTESTKLTVGCNQSLSFSAGYGKKKS